MMYAELDTPCGNDMTRTWASTEAKIQLRRFDRFLAEDMERVVESAQIAHAQLGKGVFSGSTLRVSAGSKILDSGIYSQAILARGPTPTERVFLGFALPAQTGGIVWGHRLDLPTPFLFSEGVELSCRLEPGTHWIGLNVPRQELEAYGLWLPDEHSGLLNCGSESRSLLRGSISAIHQGLARSADSNPGPANARFVEDRFDRLLTAFARALSPEPSTPCFPVSRRHRVLVRAAQDYLDANLAEAVRIRDLCVMLGASYKTLERAFLSVLGVTPRHYLSFVRLTRARRLLITGRKARIRIADVALSCGYCELGRFSRYYREWFGETPSQTLQRTT